MTETPYNFLFGVQNYIENIPANLAIAHNWHMIMSALYGTIYSSLFTIYIIWLIYKLQKYAGLLYVVILMSGILNINGVLIPIIFISFLYFINNSCNRGLCKI